MSNIVFPTLAGLTFPVERNAVWMTKTQPAVSGKETRLNLWSYPRYEYTLSYDVLRSDSVNLEFQTILDFYNARQGAFDSWLFNDPDDNTATAQTFGTGDGATTAFQLARTLPGGGFSEPVKAVNTITQVTKNGTPTAAYTYVAATGVLTFTVAPTAGQVLAWTGTYYWRCRFMDDTFNLSKFANQFWETKTLKFQSLK